jgi:hypothetical protein
MADASLPRIRGALLADSPKSFSLDLQLHQAKIPSAMVSALLKAHLHFNGRTNLRLTRKCEQLASQSRPLSSYIDVHRLLLSHDLHCAARHASWKQEVHMQQGVGLAETQQTQCLAESRLSA